MAPPSATTTTASAAAPSSTATTPTSRKNQQQQQQHVAASTTTTTTNYNTSYHHSPSPSPSLPDDVSAASAADSGYSSTHPGHHHSGTTSHHRTTSSAAFRPSSDSLSDPPHSPTYAHPLSPLTATTTTAAAAPAAAVSQGPTKTGGGPPPSVTLMAAAAHQASLLRNNNNSSSNNNQQNTQSQHQQQHQQQHQHQTQTQLLSNATNPIVFSRDGYAAFLNASSSSSSVSARGSNDRSVPQTFTATANNHFVTSMPPQQYHQQPFLSLIPGLPTHNHRSSSTTTPTTGGTSIASAAASAAAIAAATANALSASAAAAAAAAAAQAAPPCDYASIVKAHLDDLHGHFPGGDRSMQLNVLGVPLQNAKSRVETQIKLCLSLVQSNGEKVPLWSYLRLPDHLATRERTRSGGTTVGGGGTIAGGAAGRRGGVGGGASTAGAFDPEDANPKDILDLSATVVCATNPSVDVVTCAGCIHREKKRVTKKNLAESESLATDEDRLRMDQARIVLFNCQNIVDFSSGDTILPSRITCYCRHHNEKVGFCIYFMARDHTGAIVATGVSPPILITDDHKSTSKLKSLKRSRADDTEDQLVAASNAAMITANAAAMAAAAAAAAAVDTNNPYMYGSGTADATNPYMYGSLLHTEDLFSPPTASASPATAIIKEDTPALSSMSSPPSFLSPLADSTFRELTIDSDYFATLTPPAKRANINTLDGTGLVVPNGADTTEFKLEDAMFCDSVADALLNSLENVTTPMLPSLSSASTTSGPTPTIGRVIPAEGPMHGGTEITLLGSGFHAGLTVLFGDVPATHCAPWGSTTMVCVLPPSSIPGPVPVTFREHPAMAFAPAGDVAIFTYKDDSERALMELALQVVGLRMTGRLEDARNVAMRIVSDTARDDDSGGNNGSSGSNNGNGMTSVPALMARILAALTSANPAPRTAIERFLVNALIATGDSAAHLDTRDARGQTLLHLASFAGMSLLVQYLLTCPGIDVDVRDRAGHTPLMFAAIGGGELGVVVALLRAAANPFLTSARGVGALSWAARGGYHRVRDVLRAAMWDVLRGEWIFDPSENDDDGADLDDDDDEEEEDMVAKDGEDEKEEEEQEVEKDGPVIEGAVEGAARVDAEAASPPVEREVMEIYEAQRAIEEVDGAADGLVPDVASPADVKALFAEASNLAAATVVAAAAADEKKGVVVGPGTNSTWFSSFAPTQIPTLIVLPVTLPNIGYYLPSFTVPDLFFGYGGAVVKAPAASATPVAPVQQQQQQQQHEFLAKGAVVAGPEVPPPPYSPPAVPTIHELRQQRDELKLHLHRRQLQHSSSATSLSPPSSSSSSSLIPQPPQPTNLDFVDELCDCPAAAQMGPGRQDPIHESYCRRTQLAKRANATSTLAAAYAVMTSRGALLLVWLPMLIGFLVIILLRVFATDEEMDRLATRFVDMHVGFVRKVVTAYSRAKGRAEVLRGDVVDWFVGA